MTLEERVELLEQTISDLKEQLEVLSHSTSHSLIQMQLAIANLANPSN
jgi:hypothetical protein